MNTSTRTMITQEAAHSLIHDLAIAAIELFWLGGSGDDTDTALLQAGMRAAATALSADPAYLREQEILLANERERATATTRENPLPSTLPDGTLLQTRPDDEMAAALRTLAQARQQAGTDQERETLRDTAALLHHMWGLDELPLRAADDSPARRRIQQLLGL